MIIILGMISCTPYVKESYSLSEIHSLVAIKEAEYMSDSVEVLNMTFPIVKIDKNAYYAGESVGSGIRYYLVKK